MNLLNKKSYRIDEVGDYFSVTKRTVYSWIKSGMLESTGTGTRRRISAHALMKSRRPFIPPDLNNIKYIKRAINNRISSAINGTIRGHCHKKDWETIVGFTADQLKKHLERQFTDGMTWKKFIHGRIHIDHIIPKSAFNFKTVNDLDFKKCWSLKNLQPMWAKENIIKSDKINHPFQPQLLISAPLK